MPVMKDKTSAMSYCAIVHLVLFFTVANLLMGRESMLQMLEYVLDAFEMVFSQLPLDNPNILLDTTTKAIAMKVFAIFLATAMPAYFIGYPVFSRFYKIDY
jgi:hypothetical protein